MLPGFREEDFGVLTFFVLLNKRCRWCNGSSSHTYGQNERKHICRVRFCCLK